MIPYGRQSINQGDIDAVTSALNGDFLTTGPLVNEFESELEKIVGAPCIAVSSGTAALHSAYAAINLQPGDEVITPPLTFIATQSTAAFFGAKIVFSDIKRSTGNIDPKLVEKAITEKTKAVVAVDYAGQPAELDTLRTLTDKYGIFLIEDAAHSIGSRFKGRPVGSIADLTTFSFFPTKNMTTAEGGAVASLDKELLLRARRFSRQGLVREVEEFKILTEGSWHQEVHDFGLNYRLPDVLCALGISQLQRISQFKERRQEIFNYYTERLQNVPGLILPTCHEENDVMWHLYPLRVPSQARETIFNYLHDVGIKVQVNYLPAYRHPVFSNYNIPPGTFPESDAYYASEISLPIFPDLTNLEMDKIIYELLRILSGDIPA